MMEKFGNHCYLVEKIKNKWVYFIYREEQDKHRQVTETFELFDSRERATFAAIGHITLLEKGEEACLNGLNAG